MKASLMWRQLQFWLQPQFQLRQLADRKQ